MIPSSPRHRQRPSRHPQRQQQQPVLPASSSQRYHRRPQHHDRQHQHEHEYETPRNHHHQSKAPISRRTPQSAQHYQGSIASVSRQERFRQQQQEYFPHHQAQQPQFTGIGLDYVEDIRAPSPLVLDPSAPITPSTASGAASASAATNARQEGMMQNLLKGIGVAGSTSATSSPSRNNQHYAHGNLQPPPQHTSSRQAQQHHHQHHHQGPPEPPTATDLARLAPQAGFLHKLGTNIASYKRRFFVLQPSTHLYYFLSPHDTVPRGAIAMDDATVRIVETLSDGRTRIELKWPVNGRTVHLEARSPEAAQEWCAALKQERLSHVRSQFEESQQELAKARNEIDDLQKQLEHFRYVEQDRDGALEDARKWKEQFEQLDEAIRVLANHVRKLPTTTDDKDECTGTGGREKQETNAEEGETGDATNEGANQPNGESECPTTNNDQDNGEHAPDVVKDEPYDNGEKPATRTDHKDKDESDDDETKPTTRPEHKTSDVGAAEGETTGAAGEEEDSDVNKSRRDISLLDDDAAAEEAAAALFESSNIIEQLDAPGQHFSALINACQQLRENLRLASEEAIAAVEDTKAAQDVSKALQARMTKAEKQLCNLWEENCSIRKTLKQKKREKRVLVREVKSLMEQQQQYQQQLRQRHLAQQLGYHSQQLASVKPSTNYSSRLPQGVDADDDASTIMGSDEEERLINELEEHVVSSIRLHEEFISASGVKSIHNNKQPEPPSLSKRLHDVEPSSCSSTATTTASTQSGARNIRFTRSDTTSTATTTVVHHPASNKAPLLSPPRPRGAPMPSLFDRSSFESESEADSGEVQCDLSNRVAVEEAGDEDEDEDDAEELSSRSPPKMVVDESGFPKPVDIDGRSISSVAASLGGDSVSSEGRREADTPLRPNPILQLDREEMEEAKEEDDRQRFKPINVARPAQATSRLVCPLADVVQTKPRGDGASIEAANSHQDELQIYHLTFYTQKIGLQFQKVPAPPTKPRGLLTDAMTADLAGDPRGANKTASELKRVAAIATWAKNDADHGDADAETCLQVATPVDAVLVCGFDGFDDSGNNIRPKLGARLVAFDGVSVEVGRWTFDSIRKSIQARGRPLTLSFRNDFLTTDQRAIMTKAVSQAERKPPPLSTPELFSKLTDPIEYGSVVQYRHHVEDARPDSRASAPSLPGVSSHETDQFVNETFRTSNVIKLHEREPPRRWEDEEDDLTVSTTGYHSDYHYHHRPRQHRRLTGSSGGSYHSRNAGAYTTPYRSSFSETGSSASVLSSAIGPLMSNLLGGLSDKKKQVNMNPSYLHSRIPVESTPQHQEFQAGLL